VHYAKEPVSGKPRNSRLKDWKNGGGEKGMGLRKGKVAGGYAGCRRSLKETLLSVKNYSDHLREGGIYSPG